MTQSHFNFDGKPDPETLFDPYYAYQLKTAGMDKSAAARKRLLEMAREIAILLGRRMPEITIDDVQKVLIANGVKPSQLGNAAGSVFKGDAWICVGRHKSTRASRHANEVRVWKLRS